MPQTHCCLILPDGRGTASARGFGCIGRLQRITTLVRRVLYVLSGRGLLDGRRLERSRVWPRRLTFLQRRVVHALPKLIEGPVVFLRLIRRDATQGHHLVNPEDGTPRRLFAPVSDPPGDLLVEVVLDLVHRKDDAWRRREVSLPMSWLLISV